MVAHSQNGPQWGHAFSAEHGAPDFGAQMWHQSSGCPAQRHRHGAPARRMSPAALVAGMYPGGQDAYTLSRARETQRLRKNFFIQAPLP